MTDEVAEFAKEFEFPLDDYQLAGCQSLADGASVLVAAPTGAGKTVVGEFAVWHAMATGRKCFYTTPIKALSNQKYNDLVERWGADKVGLLTGDQTVNGEGQIVVMTTEVLRNMIYAASPTLHNLGYVVLDEVHYLADKFRGAVWEEVILGLADSVSLVALSATVSNVEEFGDWLETVRGRLDLIVSERRPVPLFQHVMVGKRLIDLFDGVAPTAAELPGSGTDRVNPELLRAARTESHSVRDDARRPRGASGRGKRQTTYGSRQFGGATHGRFAGPKLTVSRWDLVTKLRNVELLPAICFIFSRQGCDGAVRQLSDLRLTNAAERSYLGELADTAVAHLEPGDLAALGYEDFRAAFVNGIAAHHAGLLPIIKSVVEAGFASGALKMVFATETLALGINMPARTVVLEKLVKYNGEAHVDVTPGEYTQLTGRAGRRGIDVEGHAVVLWQPGMDPRALAGLASRRTYRLKSSFAPTYNMAVNLIATQGMARSRELLEQSFAQFQTDKSVVGDSRAAARLKAQLREATQQLSCSAGDFLEYARLRDQIGQLEAEAQKTRKRLGADAIADALAELVPGDVIWLPKRGWSTVVAVGKPQRRGEVAWIRTLGSDHTVLRLTAQDFRVPPSAAARIRVPKRFSLRERNDRRAVIAATTQKLGNTEAPEPVASAGQDQEVAAQISKLRAELAAHPCHQCPDRETHAVLAARVIRLERELAKTDAAGTARANSLANAFDKITEVLAELGYLDGELVTDEGRRLRRIYGELDLVTAECIRRGVFEGLDAPSLAAVLSSLVYEARLSRGAAPARMPNRDSAQAQSKLREVWRDVGLLERRHRMDRSREPDIGFAEATWRWASGQDLAKVLYTSGLPAGDFVRWTRQVIDIAGQVGAAAGPGDLKRTCNEAVWAMRRGVIDD